MGNIWEIGNQLPETQEEKEMACGFLEIGRAAVEIKTGHIRRRMMETLGMLSQEG